MRGYKTADALTSRENPVFIKTQHVILQYEIQHAFAVLNIMRKGIVPIAVPAAAVMICDNMEPNAPKSLRQVEIFLYARETVRKQYHRVRAFASCAVDGNKQLAALSLRKLCHKVGPVGGVSPYFVFFQIFQLQTVSSFVIVLFFLGNRYCRKRTFIKKPSF